MWAAMYWWQSTSSNVAVFWQFSFELAKQFDSVAFRPSLGSLGSLRLLWSRFANWSPLFLLFLALKYTPSYCTSRLVLLLSLLSGFSKCGSHYADSFLMHSISCRIWPTHTFDRLSRLQWHYNRPHHKSDQVL